ncbi:MAG TPA: phosphatase PAP2 family protein [Flavobacterium sp.]|jgi:undecaprenyl-diphosphatase
MIEKLLKLDQELFVFLNSLGSETFDGFWLLITKQVSWVPVFAIILYLLVKHLGWRHVLLLVVLITLLLTITDQSTNFIKNHFQRLRPGNNPELSHIMRIVQSRKSFSFFSGHAANSMAVAMFLFRVLRPYIKYMGFIFIWPFIFAYSRIYLGLHYPLDIVCGYIWGILMSMLMYKIYQISRDKIFPAEKENLDHPTNI